MQKPTVFVLVVRGLNVYVAAGFNSVATDGTDMATRNICTNTALYANAAAMPGFGPLARSTDKTNMFN
jgi:hypothetical protein